MVVMARYPETSGSVAPKTCNPSASSYAPLLPLPLTAFLTAVDLCAFVKLEGRLHLASPECASTDGTFFSVSYDIWRRSDDDADGRGPCPSMFPFEIVLPEVFTDRGVRRALPPTYEIEYPYAADIRANCSYLLRVVLQRRGSKLAIWKHPKK